jgi:hypothetical protein
MPGITGEMKSSTPYKMEETALSVELVHMSICFDVQGRQGLHEAIPR